MKEEGGMDIIWTEEGWKEMEGKRKERGNSGNGMDSGRNGWIPCENGRSMLCGLLNQRI